MPFLSLIQEFVMGENWSKHADDGVREVDFIPRVFNAVRTANLTLLKHLCNNIAPDELWKLRYEGTTLLHYAVLYEQPESLKILLETKGSNADERNKEWNTPLSEILRISDHNIEAVNEILKLLLKHKADINARTFVNRTILLKSLVCRRYDISLLLLKYGADPNLGDNDGLRPIHVCASYAELNLMEKIISYGANINGQDHNGRTALYFAILSGHENIFNFLLSRGCNPNYGLKYKLPLQTAIVKCKPKFVLGLLKSGVFVNNEITEYCHHYSGMHDYLNLALLVTYIQYDSYRLRNGDKQILNNFIASLQNLDLITQAVSVTNNFSKNPFFRTCWLPLKLPEFLPYNHELRHIVTRLLLMHEMNYRCKLQTMLPVVEAEVDKMSLKMICIMKIRQLICCTTNVIYAVEKLGLPKVLKKSLLLKDI